jgi:hypothetical protein
MGGIYWDSVGFTLIGKTGISLKIPPISAPKTHRRPALPWNAASVFSRTQPNPRTPAPSQIRRRLYPMAKSAGRLHNKAAAPKSPVSASA